MIYYCFVIRSFIYVFYLTFILVSYVGMAKCYFILSYNRLPWTMMIMMMMLVLLMLVMLLKKKKSSPLS